MFKDFDKRLQRDIKKTVDFRVKRSEELSGGSLKVNCFFLRFVLQHDTGIKAVRDLKVCWLIR